MNRFPGDLAVHDQEFMGSTQKLIVSFKNRPIGCLIDDKARHKKTFFYGHLLLAIYSANHFRLFELDCHHVDV